ncbi:hypothetical protein [Alkalihalobacillus sp. LMS39]|uniref:hypothetical protein n=1 Tax=Alkalihalobacillus sp. LMS39 TaxID=2924032 RepID=UPI001FB391D6|nr:hypothetical protein [Alkalihalobacillus sp. LMS39]UOE92712.1 hypothetical protein MM271_15925 [Alkalihalobacillus sp. LMS39]
MVTVGHMFRYYCKLSMFSNLFGHVFRYFSICNENETEKGGVAESMSVAISIPLIFQNITE